MSAVGPEDAVSRDRERERRPERAGLGPLLAALGFADGCPRLAIGILLIAAFEVSFLVVASAQAVVERALDWSPPWVVVGVWGVWTAWHSGWFPRRRERHLRRPRPYRSAFVSDIYPWVTVGFAQMWRPLLNGDVLGRALAAPRELVPPPPLAVLGLTLCTAALLVMIRAIRTIGIANAAFVPEFREAGRFAPIHDGVYGRFKHPLFWSGILFSVGLAILVATRVAFVVAGLNVVYGLVYSVLEDHRMRRVFGPAYASYASRVPGLPGVAALLGGLRRLLPGSSRGGGPRPRG